MGDTQRRSSSPAAHGILHKRQPGVVHDALLLHLWDLCAWILQAERNLAVPARSYNQVRGFTADEKGQYGGAVALVVVSSSGHARRLQKEARSVVVNQSADQARHHGTPMKVLSMTGSRWPEHTVPAGGW